MLIIGIVLAVIGFVTAVGMCAATFVIVNARIEKDRWDYNNIVGRNCMIILAALVLLLIGLILIAVNSFL
jgi:hypothetical protein